MIKYKGYVNARNGGFREYHDIDDYDFYQSGECDDCEVDRASGECAGCFGYLGRGDGVLVLIKGNKVVAKYDNDDIFDYGFDEYEDDAKGGK